MLRFVAKQLLLVVDERMVIRENGAIVVTYSTLRSILLAEKTTHRSLPQYS